MRKLLASIAMIFIMGASSSVSLAENVFQTASSSSLRTGEGANAVQKGIVEVKPVEGASGGQVARIKSDMNQWGYVTCWFGSPAPAGKSVVRIRAYFDGQKNARYVLYGKGKADQVMIGEVKVPAGAVSGSFVTIDLPVNSAAEWSGLVIKKIDTSSLPSLWIDTMSIVLVQ